MTGAVKQTVTDSEEPRDRMSFEPTPDRSRTRRSLRHVLRKAADRDVLALVVHRRARAVARQPGLFFTRLNVWSRFTHHVKDYRVIGEEELRSTRRSDTLFIFGSGASLNDIPEAEWREFEQHDTMGFTWFVRQQFVRCDYHLIRELAPARGDDRSVRVQLEEYFGILRDNELFRDAVFLVQTGWRAVNGNQAIGYELLPKSNRVFLWRTLIGPRLPSLSLDRGLTHAYGTLHECVNFGFLLGWRRIVLVGVDLYDRRYFWLDPSERDQPGRDEPHSTAQQGVVELMGRWNMFLNALGVELFVYNPRSLLARTLPVWAAGEGSQLDGAV